MLDEDGAGAVRISIHSEFGSEAQATAAHTWLGQ